MTYGSWLAEARSGLTAAAEQMRTAATTAPSNPADTLAAATARRDAYRGLARHVDLLIGKHAAAPPPTQAEADAVLGRRRDPLARFHVGLRAAAHASTTSSYGEASSPAALALRAAADAIATAGDILASHVRLPAGPYTAEGAAIRAGGGVAAGLADIAALTKAAIAVDRRLIRWLDQPAGSLMVEPTIQAARWTTRSGLDLVAGSVIRAGRHQPALLYNLDVAPPSPQSHLTVSDDPTRALMTVRTWLERHPAQVHAGHLHAATQLGLALCLIQPRTPRPELGHWRSAAIAAANLYGTAAPAGHPQDAGRILNDLLTWLRDEVRTSSTTKDEIAARSVANDMADQLPMLANALAAGVNHAVARGDLFLQDKELRRPLGALVHYATSVWRPASTRDEPIRRLTEALYALAPTQTAQFLQTRTPPIAALAFPAWPRFDGAATTNDPGRDTVSDQVSRRRGR